MSTRQSWLWLALAGCCWFALPGLGATPVTDLAVPICATAPVIDGTLDDACWRQAAIVDTFQLIADDAGPARRHKAYVARDAAWLYVAFDVDLPLDQRDPALYVGHDNTIQREDNVQVSFDPGTDGDLFFQFLVNKANTRADFRMTKAKGRERESWNIPWKSAVTTDPLGWKAEIALPLCLLTEHGNPARAQLNLIIDTFRVLSDAQHVKTGVAREFWSWAPLTGISPANAWNAPEQFVRLNGFSLADLKAPLLPYMQTAACGRYYTTNNALHYDVNVDLLFSSSASGAMTLAVTDVTAGGKTNVAELVLPVSGRAMQMPARVPVPAAGMTERRVYIRLLDSATRECWQELTVETGSALNLFAAFLDQDYYTTEPNAVAVCRIGLAEDALKDMKLVARLEGRELAALVKPRPETQFSIPLKTAPVGERAVRLELVAADGTPASSVDVSLVKRAPRPGCEWKVDRLNNRLLDNGKPFFPFGMLMNTIKPDMEYAFAEMSKTGFNTMLQWSYKPEGDRSDPEGAQVADIKAYLETAARHGLKVVAVPDLNYVPFNERTMVKDPGKLLTPDELKAVNRDLNSDTCSLGLSVKGMLLFAIPGRDAKTKAAIVSEYYENQLPYLLPVLREAARHPNLAGLFIFDEPFLNPEFGQLPAARAFYRQIKEADGYHPVFANCTPQIHQFPDAWFDWMDVLGVDPYWTPEYAGSSRATIDFVAWMAHQTVIKAQRLHLVPTTLMQGAEYSGVLKRALTTTEQICQTYLALIHGIKSIFYFCYPERAQANWDTLCELAHRMNRLGPICLEPAIPQEVDYSGGPYDFDARRMPDIQVSLKRDPDGGFVLLAASIANRPVATVFKLALLDRNSTVKELFNGRQFSVKDGGITDTIEPLGTRAYHITAAEPTRQPVAISVAMTPQGPEPDRPIAYGITGRIGMKNLLPNPSLEEASVPGRPDYWRQTGAELKPWERMGGTNQVWGLTTNLPYHGTQCLMMVSSDSEARMVYAGHEFTQRTPEQYVFSVWLRSEQDQAQAFLHAGKESRAVKVTREWRRHSLPFSAAAGRTSVMVRFHGDSRSALWVDAFQLEKGDTPTEFQP